MLHKLSSSRHSRKAVPLLVFLATMRPVLGAESPTPPAASQPLTVSMRVDVESPNRLLGRQLMPGETAHTGERFSITAWTGQQPAYLYVVHYRPDSWSELMFPVAPNMRVAPGERVRVPEAQTQFTLAGEPGDMTFAVLASPEPIDEASCRELRLDCPLFRKANGTRGGSDQPKHTKEPPPREDKNGERSEKSSAKDGTRGGSQSEDSVAKVVSKRSDVRGRALLWFSFRQEQ